MECAGGGRRSQCSAPATVRCECCRAVAYCSVTHQISHRIVHKEQCKRFQQQMRVVSRINDFPFTFHREAIMKVLEKQMSRCLLLEKLGLHGVGMWMCECSCRISVASSHHLRVVKGWNLSSVYSPCKEPSSSISKKLSSWKDYYEWRCIPFDSPVALLLHWPLTLYWAIQIAVSRSLIPEIGDEVCIHYLGPNKELSQLAVFGELLALFPGVEVNIDFVGPDIPKNRDGEVINIHSYAPCNEIDCICKSSEENLSYTSSGKTSAVKIRLHSGYYHDRYTDITENFLPDLIIAPNAGVAACTSWLPTIELIKEIEIVAIFTDYCEEACHLATSCISSVTSSPPKIPIELNSFRQPLVVEDSPLSLPCYSNCFVFGM